LYNNIHIYYPIKSRKKQVFLVIFFILLYVGAGFHTSPEDNEKIRGGKNAAERK